jgi:myo-inositol-1(or 4)-monophosphatase
MAAPHRRELDFAMETAYLAGRLTLGFFQTGVVPDRKADDSPVTVADRKAEELIRSRIERAYPSHAILGEEFGETNHEGATHRWIIDPIDGTKAFVHGVPLYSVLLGLEIEGTAELGVVYFPALDEMLSAATGSGCRWNGRLVRVSSVADVARATVCFTDPAAFAEFGRAEAWERIQRAASICAGWSDAYGHALVATGRAEIALDPIMNAWDCGPFPPILKEAGGTFTDWSGEESIRAGEAVSTNGLLLPELLELIRG